jgi:hypothetical protein
LRRRCDRRCCSPRCALTAARRRPRRRRPRRRRSCRRRRSRCHYRHRRRHRCSPRQRHRPRRRRRRPPSVPRHPRGLGVTPSLPPQPSPPCPQRPSPPRHRAAAALVAAAVAAAVAAIVAIVAAVAASPSSPPLSWPPPSKLLLPSTQPSSPKNNFKGRTVRAFSLRMRISTRKRRPNAPSIAAARPRDACQPLADSFPHALTAAALSCLCERSFYQLLPLRRGEHRRWRALRSPTALWLSNAPRIAPTRPSVTE